MMMLMQCKGVVRCRGARFPPASTACSMRHLAVKPITLLSTSLSDVTMSVSICKAPRGHL